ncbi:MAG: lipoyl(octanoyl) transferase LipB [Crocinitomicaceae bacterium]|nr:lipoyl(octanoyl) transferase LipB [Crocinitomicaceae bacterium]
MLKRAVTIRRLGLINYKEAWDLQEKIFKELVDIKIKNRNDNTSVLPQNQLLVCEHPHVFTLGKSGKEDHLLLDNQGLKDNEADYYKINRGGDITYHGPGQLVVYPIFDLEQFFTDIHKYMRFLEEAVILTLSEYGIHGERMEGQTGVWLGVGSPVARKICAMGVKSSRWITMHGLGFNVNADLKYFDYIIPCGISDKSVTSMQYELGRKIDMDELSEKLVVHLSNLFDFTI